MKNIRNKLNISKATFSETAISKVIVFKVIGQVAAIIFCLSLSNITIARDIEIGGILVNKTITWFGQDFFKHFAREWRNQYFQGDGVEVEEKPSARQGTLVIVRYKGNVVYRASIAGTRSQSRERGAQAVSYVLSRIQNIDIAASGYGQVDLSGDEF